VKIIYLFAN